MILDDSELVFKAYCIEYFRRRHGISSREALSIFKRYGVIGYSTGITMCCIR